MLEGTGGLCCSLCVEKWLGGGGWHVKRAGGQGFDKELYKLTCDTISCVTQVQNQERSENMYKEYWISVGNG